MNTGYILEIRSSTNPKLVYQRKIRASKPEMASVIAERQLHFDRRYLRAGQAWDTWTLFGRRKNDDRMVPLATGHIGH